MQRLATSRAYGLDGFPVAGWAVFIGTVFVLAAIFHFLLEAYSRRMAWMVLFLAGFIPLFASLVLISISHRWVDTARYLTSLSPLSAPFQPLDWLRQTELSRHSAGGGRAADFGPFALFCAVHVGLFAMLLVVWRRKRKARQARA
jgi:hypothetical protein